MGKGGGSKRDEIDKEKIKRALNARYHVCWSIKQKLEFEAKPKPSSSFESPSRLTAAAGLVLFGYG